METTTGSKGEFTRSLAMLKRRGSNLLVVGSPSVETRRRACRRLLGDGIAATRRRLFVFTDRAYTHERLGTGPNTAETVRVVTRSSPTRSAATAPVSTGTPLSGIPRRHVVSDSLGSFAWAVEDELQSFRSQTGEFDSGELRLCFDSLGPLLSDHSVADTKRFVSVLGDRIRSVSGMAHYHIPAAPDDPVVAELTPAFDAVIELRQKNGEPRHRWTFTDRRLTSDWLPF